MTTATTTEDKKNDYETDQSRHVARKGTASRATTGDALLEQSEPEINTMRMKRPFWWLVFERLSFKALAYNQSWSNDRNMNREVLSA